MAVTVLMVPVFWIMGHLGHLSPPGTALGIGGVVILFIRHLTQLPLYDRRALVE
jgi:hypothetical protein